MSSKNILYIIFACGIIVAFMSVIVAWVIWQFLPGNGTPSPTLTTVDETADWNIFNNPGDGYEIKYPFNWNYTRENGSVCFKNPGMQYTLEESDEMCIISIYKLNPENFNIEAWTETFTQYNGTTTRMKIGSYNAIQGENYLETAILIEHPEKDDVKININIPNFEDEDSNKNIINLILSTFKFINN